MSGSLSSPLELKVGVPQGSILGPTLFSIYINDLPLSLNKAEVDIYTDDTTIWSSGNTCEEIQQKLQNTLNNTERWFKANGMVPNTRKTKQLLVGTVQSDSIQLHCASFLRIIYCVISARTSARAFGT